MTISAIKITLFLLVAILCGCINHPPAEQVILTREWVKNREQWLTMQRTRIEFASYRLDGGSVVAYLSDENGHRWDLLLESPGQAGRDIELKILVGSSGHSSFVVPPKSSDEQHLLHLLKRGTANTKVLKAQAGEVLYRWVQTRDSREGLQSIKRDGVIVHLVNE